MRTPMIPRRRLTGPAGKIYAGMSRSLAEKNPDSKQDSAEASSANSACCLMPKTGSFGRTIRQRNARSVTVLTSPHQIMNRGPDRQRNCGTDQETGGRAVQIGLAECPEREPHRETAASQRGDERP